MPDYGHDLQFGSFMVPVTEAHEAVLSGIETAEALELDLIALQDHPYNPQLLDVWALIGAAAARTERIRFVPMVANLPLRPPAMLAREAANHDLLSGGRIELGLGAGAFWDAIESMGGERRSPGDAVESLEEAIAVIRALWSTDEQSVSVDGTFYRLRGATPGPVPPHPIGIWLGAYKPRMLRITGRLADGIMIGGSYAPPDTLPAMHELIDTAAVKAGRHPGEIRRIYAVEGQFTDSNRGYLQGPVKQWVEQLTELAVDKGIGTFLLTTMPGRLTELRRFAEEVAPAVREAVCAERGAEQPEAAAAKARQQVDIPHREVDPSVRPHFDPPPGDPADTDPGGAGRASIEKLIQIHNHLRAELADLQRAVGEVLAGRDNPSVARSLISRMTMRQNYWTLGSFCAGYLRLVTTHHAIEDQSTFPTVLSAEPRMKPVIDQLTSEHESVAELITRLDMALVDMIEKPAQLEEVRRALDKLGERLLSHLDYEERELADTLIRHHLEI